MFLVKYYTFNETGLRYNLILLTTLSIHFVYNAKYHVYNLYPLNLIIIE